MTEREKLIELLNEARRKCTGSQRCLDCVGYGNGAECINHLSADYLLENGVLVPPYKPFPLVMDENSADVLCPFCDTDLSGYYCGRDYEPPKIVPCFECGTWLDWTKAITREEAEKALAERSEKNG